MRLSILLLAALVLSGCQTSQLSSGHERFVADTQPISFLSPAPFHERCEIGGTSYFESADAEFVTSNHIRETRAIKKSIQGLLVLMLNPATRDESAFKKFLTDFVTHIDDGNFQGVRDSQRGISSFDYDADGRGTPDPGYGAQSLLVNVAKLVSLADSLNIWASEEQREKVIRWGNKLRQESHQDRRGRTYSRQMNDNVAMRALSYLAWSMVSGSSALRKEAEKAFDHTLNRLNSDGSMTDWLDEKHRAHRKDSALKEDDKTVGYLVIAAHYASFLGADWYQKESYQGQTLDDAVAWLLSAHTKPDSTNQALKLKDQLKIGSGLNLGDWAWTTAYVADRADTPTGRALREVSKNYEGLGYWNKQLGYTSCYYGYVGDN